jgi:class 3 adenylate cyclase
MGDAVLVFFGDPETQGVQEDALACVRMAVEMKEAIAGLNREWERRGIGRGFAVRMGVTTGFCTVGNFGSEQRLAYTIIGNQVNLASRLQAAAQPGEILIAHETWLLVREAFDCVAKELIQVKGFERPVQTHQVIGPRAAAGAGTSIIEESRQGFSLTLDPAAVEAADRAIILERLQAALDRLR